MDDLPRTHLALNLLREIFPFITFFFFFFSLTTNFVAEASDEESFSFHKNSSKSQINPIYFTCQFLGKQLHYMTDFIIGNEKAKEEGNFIGS